MRYLFVCIFLVPFLVAGQEHEIPTDELNKMEFAGVYKSTISAEIGGKSGFVGISYDRLLSARTRIGVGAGFKGVGLDFKYYPIMVSRDRWLFNLGLRANLVNVPSPYLFCSLPIGVSFFGLSRLNFDVDAGPLYKFPIAKGVTNTDFTANWNYVWFSVKVGYRFSFYAMRRARRLNQEIQ